MSNENLITPVAKPRGGSPTPRPPSSTIRGRLAYRLYFQPRTWLGDRFDRFLGQRGDRAMRKAAAYLEPLPLPFFHSYAPPCRFLTGERFVHQTIFCARSFEWACSSHFDIEIFSDGTLRSEHLEMIRRTLPRVVVQDERLIAGRLEQHLPRARFPLLRAMRDRTPLMRKVVDLHAGLHGPSLSLDSDMLFFRPPLALMEWLAHPRQEYFMSQESDALVADRQSLGKVLGAALLPGVNSGILAIDDDAIDWDDLERAAAALNEDQRRHLWAEQTLIAYHLTRRDARPLPIADYRLCNSRADFTGELPVLRHYVHKAKAVYAAGEWRRWLNLSASLATAIVLMIS